MKVICFGDSNTWGYDPRDCFGGRYPAEYRWVDILAEKTGWEIKNWGMNGQEIPKGMIPLPEHTNHLIVMLGTNDLLQGTTASKAAERMEEFLKMVPLHRNKIMLIAPPTMKLGAWVSTENLVKESAELAKNYRKLAQRLGVRYANAGEWNVSLAYDGVHFTEKGHQSFAEGIRKELEQ